MPCTIYPFGDLIEIAGTIPQKRGDRPQFRDIQHQHPAFHDHFPQERFLVDNIRRRLLLLNGRHFFRAHAETNADISVAFLHYSACSCFFFGADAAGATCLCAFFSCSARGSRDFCSCSRRAHLTNTSNRPRCSPAIKCLRLESSSGIGMESAYWMLSLDTRPSSRMSWMVLARIKNTRSWPYF